MVTKRYIYRDVAAWVRENIGGRFQVGQFLPSGPTLLQMYNAERGRHTTLLTLREGLRLLQEEGIIQSRQGQGTRVLSHPSLPEKDTAEEDTTPAESRPLMSTPTTHQEFPRMRSPYTVKRPWSDETTTHKGVLPTSSLGTSDRMEILDLGSRVQLEFVAANRFDVPNRTIVLTKFPAAIVNAMTGVLNAKSETIVDCAGQNFKGRVCVHVIGGDPAYVFVAEFFATGKPIGYLIHLERDELVGFRDRLRNLPVSPHPTD